MTYDFPKQSVAQSKSFLHHIASPSKNIPDASHPVYPRGATEARDAGYIYGD